jgi:hypothetical protein
MIKATAQLEDGRTMVILGLADANKEELKKDRPILFDMRDVGLAPLEVCLTYRHEDGRVSLPDGLIERSPLIFGMGTATLDALGRKPLVADTESLKIFIFSAATEEDLEKMMGRFVTAETKVIRDGYKLIDVQSSVN